MFLMLGGKKVGASDLTLDKGSFREKARTAGLNMNEQQVNELFLRLDKNEDGVYVWGKYS
jgi:Ca2+-binding EF-hand superfamily protein